MHELIIQICFVVAGVVTGCTDGHIQTSDPYLTSQEVSPVYVYDAPQCVSNHYHRSHTPSITVGALRLYWPTYTSHHRAHPWCTNAHSHYHGNHWYTWKKKYKTWNRHNHHAHRPGAHYGHHKKHKKRKVIVHRPGPSKVVIKPKGKYNHHRKHKAKSRHHRSGPANVIIKPKKNKPNKSKSRKYHHKKKAHKKNPRSKVQKNYRRNNSKTKLNIPPNLYKRKDKPGARKEHNRRKHKRKRQKSRRDRR